MKKLIPASVVLAILAAIMTVAPAAAWDVDVQCERIIYVQWEYKVLTTDHQLVQDWTDGDTSVAPGTYIVKFKNGEKDRVEVPECPAPAIEAAGMLCGDPRAWVRFENVGDVPADVRFSFIPGNKAKPAVRKYVRRTIPVGATRVYGPRWVRGQVRVQVLDDTWQPVFAYKVGKTLHPKGWSKGGCPADRFGRPSWSNPHIVGSYAG